MRIVIRKKNQQMNEGLKIKENKCQLWSVEMKTKIKVKANKDKEPNERKKIKDKSEYLLKIKK